MNLLKKYLFKKKIRKYKAINRGYEKLKFENKLNIFDDIKNTLSNTSLGISNRNYLNFENHFLKTNEEKVVKQFVAQRFGLNNLTEAIIFSVGSNCSLTYPLPKPWLKQIEKFGFTINYFKSSLLWYLQIIKILLLTIFEYWKQIKNSFNFSKNEFKNYVFFDSLLINNLPLNNNSSSGIINWYLNWENRELDIENIIHTVKNDRNNVSDIKSVNILFKKSFLFPISNLYTFILVTFYFIRIIGKGFISLLLGRWWISLLSREIFLAQFYSITTVNNSAKEYLFHNSNWIYRPIWTYIAQDSGSKISFYFYSINSEKMKNKKGYLKYNNYWNLITWNRFIVWNEYQSEFINRSISHQVEILIAGYISFQSCSINNYILSNQKFIAVFDVQPVRDLYYQKLGIETEYYVPEICNSFLNDIVSVLSSFNLLILFKRKRHIGKSLHWKYRKNLEKLNSNFLVFVDPDTDPEVIIEKASAVISMPFTSTAYIAKLKGKPSVFYDPQNIIFKDDRASHGISIISGRNELTEWISKLHI
jgi:polysaccharide biosynthesis PFTS motif protein